VKTLKPFFCYFGGKWRAANRYPFPVYDTIVEPFAGAAGYSLRHFSKKVVLYDLDPAICGVWEYLIHASVEEIRALPIDVSHVDQLDACQEAKWLIGFWLNKGASQPHLSPSAWMRSGIRPNSYWGETIRDRIATQIPSIRHWKIRNASYEIAPNEAATWFVDPPYRGDCGKLYRCRLEDKDYEKLGEWCQNRAGQVIVCEREGADWLPFSAFSTTKSTPGRGKSYSKEVVWLNHSP
jgi:site-specific DNA-adenine methylase